MAFDFPNSPTVGQIYNGYTWDGEKWVQTFNSPNTSGVIAIKVFTASGTYTPSANMTTCVIEAIGGGGGGAGGGSGSPGSGTAGGITSVAGVSASGGGSGGTGSLGGSTLVPGGINGCSGGPTPGGSFGGSGGGGPYGGGGMGGAPNSTGVGGGNIGSGGGGGGGTVGTSGGGAGGGAGGTAMGTLSAATIGASQPVIIGAGGTAGAGGTGGGAAGAGFAGGVVITEYGMTALSSSTIASGAVRFDLPQGLSTNQQAQARSNVGTTKKNYIINGAMMVSQENGATAGTTIDYYPVDQFHISFSNAGTQTVQQVASPTPGGSPNRVRITATVADASVGAGDNLVIYQTIEGLRAADLKIGTASAKTVTIQFGCKGPAGTYCVAINNAGVSRSYVAEYTISSGEANTDVVKSVTIALDQSGTWLTSNAIGLYVLWALMSGSTQQTTANSWVSGTQFYATSNQFNFMSTGGNVFELFDVSLTEGTVAPPFTVPDYASELAACQRYWQKSFPAANPPSYNAGYAGAYIFSQTNLANLTNTTGTIRFPTTMRASPTITPYNPSASNGNVFDTVASLSWTGTAGDIVNENGFDLIGTPPAGTAQGHISAIHWTANARL